MKSFTSTVLCVLAWLPMAAYGQNAQPEDLFTVPEVHSSWDDLTDGIETKAD